MEHGARRNVYLPWLAEEMGLGDLALNKTLVKSCEK